MAPDTGRLLRLCAGYFASYVVTGVAVKYFQGPADQGFPGLGGMEYLFWSTLGASLLLVPIVLGAGWLRAAAQTSRRDRIAMFIAGICTAVVVPSTTLLYSLPISVLVAMVIMRGSIIVVSRLVDAVLTAQGMLKRKVYWEENVAVGFALLAVSVHLVRASDGPGFRQAPEAIWILGGYIVAYALRIYGMNWFKNTRQPGEKGPDNQTWFAIEQLVSTTTLGLLVLGVYLSGATAGAAGALRATLLAPPDAWAGALVSGMAFGVVAFFSVFIFLFQGRSATFAGLVNRLTSLVAGTAATLVSALLFGGKWPGLADWASLGIILIAVSFLARSERRRARELTAS